MLDKPKAGLKIVCIDNKSMTEPMLEVGGIYTFMKKDEKVQQMIYIEEFPDKSFCEYRFKEYK